jgi:hypothetical protein
MRMTSALLCLFVTATIAAEAPIRTIVVGDTVRAALLGNDGSGVVVARRAPRGTTVVFLDDAGDVRLETDLTIKSAVRRVGPRSLFGLVGGEENSARYVVLEQRGRGMETVWDSNKLTLAPKHRLQHAVTSDDGRMWAAVSASPQGAVQVLIGELPSYQFLTRATLTPADRPLMTSDAPILTWVRADRKQPVVALNLGRSARLIGVDRSGQPVRVLYAGSVSTIKAQPESGLVWVRGAGGLMAFEIDSGRRRFTFPARASRSIEDFFPLDDGTLAVVTSAKGKERKLEIRTPQGGARGSFPIRERSPRISPNARYVAEVSDGTVTVKRLR